MVKYSFWGWDDGSSILFWGRPKDIRRECRDRYDLFVKGKLPRITKEKRMPVYELECDMVKKKIENVRNRQYITSGTVLGLTRFFHVPKGDSDIRLVYDIKACGLNEALWDPKSWMPSADNVLDTASHSSWFDNVDSAEMFHNYTLSEKAQPYAGVDFSLAEKIKALRWERWTRMAVGISSPFSTTRMFAWVIKFIMGDRKDKANPFYWDSVVQNCPVTNEYDPSITRLYRPSTHNRSEERRGY